MCLHAFKFWEKTIHWCFVQLQQFICGDPSYEANVFTSSLELGSTKEFKFKLWKATYLTSFSTIPSSEGTPTLIAFVSSGSSWFAFSEANISAVACKLRDQIIRSRGKCRASKDNFDIMLFGVTSSPISLADCKRYHIHKRFNNLQFHKAKCNSIGTLLLLMLRNTTQKYGIWIIISIKAGGKYFLSAQPSQIKCEAQELILIWTKILMASILRNGLQEEPEEEEKEQ